MSVVYCSAPSPTHMCICDTLPLDNPKIHTALPYITEGLIWDLKIKKERSQLLDL